jgi:phosphoribosylaminoimidazolecarboxamide formyltransferase/IMP cyclohydrolase
MTDDLKKAYRTVMEDHFPKTMSITFGSGSEAQTLNFEKVTWVMDNVEKGLRYGENPGQEAAFYKLIDGNLKIGEITTIEPGRWLVSDAELLQFGKHPGKINLTDADNALNILRYFKDRNAVSIMKHNNPCGVAIGDTMLEAYEKADAADCVAAFGGCIGLTQSVDKATAEAISKRYAEVVVAPEFEDGAVEILAKRKNLRIMKINRMDKLASYVGTRFVDFKSLMDGSVIAQLSYDSVIRSPGDLIPAKVEYKGNVYEVNRKPTADEARDMIFGWLVESGITSNSVIYVKDETTVGIGTGEQDRVGVAQIARDKAYRKRMDNYSFKEYNVAYQDLKDSDSRSLIENMVNEEKGGLKGATMVSDAFFPFPDGLEVGLKEGVSSVIQPGGSLNDYMAIESCNNYNAAMVFTGQRSFKH